MWVFLIKKEEARNSNWGISILVLIKLQNKDKWEGFVTRKTANTTLM